MEKNKRAKKRHGNYNNQKHNANKGDVGRKDAHAPKFRFIARENIGAYRKDVTGYLYGGDVSRKKKLLAKQARGKKRMKRFGKVDIPSEAFMVMLKRD